MVHMKIIVFLEVTSCSLVVHYHFGGTPGLHSLGQRQIQKVPMKRIYQIARFHGPKDYLLCIQYGTTKIYFFDFTPKTREPLLLYEMWNIRCPYFRILTFITVNQHLLNIAAPHFFQGFSIFSEAVAQTVPLILQTPHTCCICPLGKHGRCHLKAHAHFKWS